MGVALIDGQHQSLIDRMNNLGEAIEVTVGRVEILKTLSFLEEYTDLHFSTEEKHMQETNYPGLGEQTQEHQKFKDILKKINEDFQEEGASSALGEDIKTLLTNWLIKHIHGVDKKFGAFLIEKNITISES